MSSTVIGSFSSLTLKIWEFNVPGIMKKQWSGNAEPNLVEDKLKGTQYNFRRKDLEMTYFLLSNQTTRNKCIHDNPQDKNRVTVYTPHMPWVTPFTLNIPWVTEYPICIAL